jgi:hypothetical protein
LPRGVGELRRGHNAGTCPRKGARGFSLFVVQKRPSLHNCCAKSLNARLDGMLPPAVGKNQVGKRQTL